MRIAVDLPAPFSPTSAWIVPGVTTRCRSSLARTPPKRLVMPLSSIMALRRHRVGHGDLAGDDFSPRLLRLADGVGRQQIPVVFVDDVADAVAVEPEHMEAAGEAALDGVFHDVVHRRVDALDH